MTQGTAEEICESSSKMITFIDLAGHHKYLHTTIFGLTSSYCPDCACSSSVYWDRRGAPCRGGAHSLLPQDPTHLGARPALLLLSPPSLILTLPPVFSEQLAPHGNTWGWHWP